MKISLSRLLSAAIHADRHIILGGYPVVVPRELEDDPSLPDLLVLGDQDVEVEIDLKVSDYASKREAAYSKLPEEPTREQLREVEESLKP